MCIEKNFNLYLLLNNAKTYGLCIFSARGFEENTVREALRLYRH